MEVFTFGTNACIDLMTEKSKVRKLENDETEFIFTHYDMRLSVHNLKEYLTKVGNFPNNIHGIDMASSCEDNGILTLLLTFGYLGVQRKNWAGFYDCECPIPEIFHTFLANLYADYSLYLLHPDTSVQRELDEYWPIINKCVKAYTQVDGVPDNVQEIITEEINAIFPYFFNEMKLLCFFAPSDNIHQLAKIKKQRDEL